MVGKEHRAEHCQLLWNILCQKPKPQGQFSLDKRWQDAVDKVVEKEPDSLVATKQCSKCKADKSLDEFSKNRDYRDGRQTQCRTCKAAYDKIYRQTKIGESRGVISRL